MVPALLRRRAHHSAGATRGTEARDGIRVYVDGVRKVDLWRDVSRTVKKTVNVTVLRGPRP
ncbi:hypothetical protein ACFWIA_24665 [Streptomyces sp. NPDC127068]|uniref:hypothetical protein n=1 Tax=Streptomyces sp. NPDC127068 TaxID=3347127 RepID=UPI003661073B